MHFTAVDLIFKTVEYLTRGICQMPAPYRPRETHILPLFRDMFTKYSVHLQITGSLQIGIEDSVKIYAQR